MSFSDPLFMEILYRQSSWTLFVYSLDVGYLGGITVVLLDMCAGVFNLIMLHMRVLVCLYNIINNKIIFFTII